MFDFVKVGEPGYPLAAVERGKKVMVGLNRTMEVGDHDFAKFSLTPSVSLDVDIPEDMDGNFYDGQVYVGLKENAFQPSSAVRHACKLRTLHDSGRSNPVECHYHEEDLTTISVILGLSLCKLLTSWNTILISSA